MDQYFDEASMDDHGDEQANQSNSCPSQENETSMTECKEVEHKEEPDLRPSSSLSKEELLERVKRMKRVIPFTLLPGEFVFSYKNFDRVKQELLKIDIVPVTTEEQFAKIEAKKPYGRKIAYRYIFDPVDEVRGPSTLITIFNGDARGLNKIERDVLHAEVSNRAIEKWKESDLNPAQLGMKGVSLFVDLFLIKRNIYNGPHVHFVEHRRGDLGLPAVGVETILPSTEMVALQMKHTDSQYEKCWSTDTRPVEMLEYLEEGISVVFFPLPADKKVRKFWWIFPFPESIRLLKDFIAKHDGNKRFEPKPSRKQKPKTSTPMMILMDNFMFDNEDESSVIQCDKNFKKWRSSGMAKWETLDDWNHKPIYIKHEGQQMENAAFLALRKAVHKHRFSVEIVNHSQIDYVVTMGETKITVQAKNKKDRGFDMRKTNKLPYNINEVDVFCINILVSEDENCDKTDPNVWGKVALIPTRMDGLDVVHSSFSWFAKENAKFFKEFDLATQSLEAFNEMERCHKLPKVSEEIIENHKRLAKLDDERMEIERKRLISMVDDVVVPEFSVKSYPMYEREGYTCGKFQSNFDADFEFSLKWTTTEAFQYNFVSNGKNPPLNTLTYEDLRQPDKRRQRIMCNYWRFYRRLIAKIQSLVNEAGLWKENPSTFELNQMYLAVKEKISERKFNSNRVPVPNWCTVAESIPSLTSLSGTKRK